MCLAYDHENSIIILPICTLSNINKVYIYIYIIYHFTLSVNQRDIHLITTTKEIPHMQFLVEIVIMLSPKTSRKTQI